MWDKVKAKLAKVLGACEYAEHLGFVAVAVVDVFDLGHGVLKLVSIWLMFSGAGAVYRARPQIQLAIRRRSTE